MNRFAYLIKIISDIVTVYATSHTLRHHGVMGLMEQIKNLVEKK